MAEIRFKASEVKNTISGLTETYNSITEIISQLKLEKDKIPSYWSAKEASNFKSRVDEIATMLDDFNIKYEGFLTLLEGIITTYSQANQSFLATIQSLKKEKGSGDS